MTKDPKVSKLHDTSIGVHEFIDEIFGQPEGEVVCVGKLGAGGGFRQMRPDEHAFQMWARRSRKGAWYFCCSTVSGDRMAWDKKSSGPDLADDDSYLMRRKELAKAAYCVVLDDIGTKISAEEADLPEPSWKLETSPGNFQWGYILDPASEDWDLFDGFMAMAVEEGCTDKGSIDRVHMFRLPGSENLKAQHDGWRARLTHWAPGVRWSLEALVALFSFTEEECRTAGRAAARGSRKPGLGGIALPEGAEVTDEVLTWLHEAGHVVHDPGGDEFVQIVCPWWEEHSDPAANTAGYSPLGRGGDKHAAFRGFKCLHEHCSARRGKDFLEWVEEEGGPWAAVHDPLPWLQQRYVFIEQGRRVADLERHATGARGWLMRLEEFSGLHAGKMRALGHDRPIQISTAFLESRLTRKVVDVLYRPGAPLMLEDRGAWFVNAYRAPVHPATSTPPAAFLQHMDYLLPDDAERTLFLDWLAFKAQNPGRRSFGIVMIAPGYGTGRSWVADLLGRTFTGVVTISLSQLTGTAKNAQYNTWAKHSQLVVAEEARDAETTVKDYYHSYETLKTVVDVRVTEREVNDKYGAQTVEPQFYNVLIFSNHKDALAIPTDDRRLAVLSNPMLRQDRDYYEAIWRALDDGEPARLWHWLQARDLSAFNPVYPPMTAAKAHMSELSAPSWDRLALNVLIEMPGELTTWRQFKHIVHRRAQEEDVDIPESAQGMLRRLYERETSATPLRARVQKGGPVERLRALRWTTKWASAEASADGEELREEVLKNGDYFSFLIKGMHVIPGGKKGT